MTDTTNRSNDAPLACALLGAEFAARKAEIGLDLFAHVEQTQELSDGYAFRFAGFDPWAHRILEFIAFEKQCCPFLTFELALEPHDGTVWLRLRGSDEVKRFVRDELAGVGVAV